ncbi:MAG: ABC transporter ATP-binding protein [Paraprevotella sp.]|nr:ABC transporter ATP-binding protein [Paraprevotella sp.]
MERHTVLAGYDLSTGYRQGRHTTVVHEGLNFSLSSGELTRLLGGNGVGKSTLLRTLAAAQPALAGRVELLGKPLPRYSGRERSTTIGVVWTDRTQAGGLTVYELVALGRQPHTGFFGRLSRHDKELVDHALEMVGMTPKARRYVSEISDGERQKALIAKVLVQECPLILLDEPTAFLDVVSRIEVMELLRRLTTEEGKAVLLSTHDIEQALTLSDRLWLMMPDSTLRCGATEDMVLAGRMDFLFDSSDVNFDARRGTYVSARKNRHGMRLQAADDRLYYWAQNAIVRQGYDVLPINADAQMPVLTLRSSQDMTLKRGDEEIALDSFAALSTVLRNS